MKITLQEIEDQRKFLNELVTIHHGDMLHPHVLLASQQLDRKIVMYLREQNYSTDHSYKK